MRKITKTMLLVEDNPDDLEFALCALRDNGLGERIVTAQDGQEALDYLFSVPPEERPEFILLDLKMPRVDGFEVLRQVRANQDMTNLPVVILSSSYEDRDLDESYRLGANSYVQKSLDYSEFTESIRLIGHYWFELNEAPGPCLEI